MQECAFLDKFEKTRKPTRNTNKKEMASIQQSNGNGVHSRFKQISPELRAEFREKFDEVSRFWGAINDSRQCGRRKKRQDKTRCVLEEVGWGLVFANESSKISDCIGISNFRITPVFVFVDAAFDSACLELTHSHSHTPKATGVFLAQEFWLQLA